MPILQSDSFDATYAAARDQLSGPRTTPRDDLARIEQWRREEWHGWFRWRVCRKSFDWSKPVWIGLLVAGFAALILYGLKTDRLYVTAGGIVVWFTAVNLAFFTYFGLILPGPPRAVPGPFQPGEKVKAAIGIYPAGYERRKLARVWVRVNSDGGEPHVFELPFAELPAALFALMKKQETWRIQRADAPRTDAVIETLTATREQIDAGAHPIRVIAWKWDTQALETFDRKK